MDLPLKSDSQSPFYEPDESPPKTGPLRALAPLGRLPVHGLPAGESDRQQRRF
jgi:hypothetical protein